MVERLERAFEAQRRIIADVGHELRTPLTAMRGEIEVALRGERPPDSYRSTLRSVLEELHHLSSISEAMILLARVEAGDLKPRRAPADLGGLASAALRRVTPRAGGRTLEFSQSGDLDAMLAVDSGMVSVVLDHLLDNAVRYTPNGTRIQASVHSDPGGATIAVRDTGPGISDDILPHLFERFYRGDPARSRTAGAGLGLTVARAIVDAHGGTITAANLPGGGFQVTVTLSRPPEPVLTAA
jgi:signal transduction histidine kinase